MAGNMLVALVAKAMSAPESLPLLSQFERWDPRVRTCSPAATRLRSENVSSDHANSRSVVV